MKKVLKTTMIAFLAIMLTGCVKYNVNMNIGNDKSVDLEIIYGMDTAYFDSLDEFSDETDESSADIVLHLEVGEKYEFDFNCTGYSLNNSSILEFDDSYNITALEDGVVSGIVYEDEIGERSIYIVVGDGEEDEESDFESSESSESSDVSVEDYEYLEKKGFKVEPYEEKTEDGKNYSGVKITKKYNSIDEISSNVKKEFNFNDLNKKDSKFDEKTIFTKKGNKYSSNIVFKYADGESEAYEEDGDAFDIKYTVTLPTKAIKSNATEVSKDGKTLTWKLQYGKNTNIEYEFNIGSNSNIVLYAGIGGALLIIIVLVVLMLKKKNKNNTSNGENPNTTQETQINTTPDLTMNQSVDTTMGSTVMPTQTVDPMAAPVNNIVAQPTMEPVSAPAVEVAPTPVADPLTAPTPVNDVVAQPTMEPVSAPAVEVAPTPVVEQPAVTEPAPVADPLTAPAPVNDVVAQPTMEPVNAPAVEVASTPVVEQPAVTEPATVADPIATPDSSNGEANQTPIQ